MTGTKRCDPCWETERLLPHYLRDGGDKAASFVRDALLDALLGRMRGQAPHQPESQPTVSLSCPCWACELERTRVEGGYQHRAYAVALESDKDKE